MSTMTTTATFTQVPATTPTSTTPRGFNFAPDIATPTSPKNQPTASSFEGKKVETVDVDGKTKTTPLLNLATRQGFSYILIAAFILFSIGMYVASRFTPLQAVIFAGVMIIATVDPFSLVQGKHHQQRYSYLESGKKQQVVTGCQ